MNTHDDRNEATRIRLNRFLSQCGLGSRRACDELIAAGHIYRNGRPVDVMGTKIDPASDRIEYRGKQVHLVRPIEYLAYYKPREVVATAHDPEGRTTIYNALAVAGRDVRHLRYAGRLDYQSEGLLLLTNDGDLIHALTHPRFHIKKIYHVKVERRLASEEIAALRGGVMSEGQSLHAGSINELSEVEAGRRQYWYEIVLFEGKNRHLRRMFEALSLRVGRIRRVQFGPVKLGRLSPGAARPLTAREIAALKNSGYKASRQGGIPAKR
ncbi:MAG: rRNA pseudouridine synthase [Chitinispirillaceae bacterium]|nr:rRNA pseudouridine synthase [Chitinispirillaceae bacterium]